MSDRWMDGGRTEKTEIAISANRGSQYKQILSSVQLDVILVSIAFCSLSMRASYLPSYLW